jgi:cyclopropane fatty-acyl-phospholipid synthase-like methyltransferase
MVHFSPDIVQSYLKDASRVLQHGGMILLHHSNYESKIEQHYGMNPHARNHMTFHLFKGFCDEAGLEIEESVVIPWGGVDELDRVSLVRKP